ncbi:DinB family protein [Pontibacter toksunensis]|uniref:DinB family protein n=1 Tax=Pontibacter toksunensis TaxID=1332631 RepID=A0ABW6BP81_9BACT
MNLKLEAKYLRLEKSRNLLLDELEVLDEGLLNTQTQEGKWSIIQHVAHLILVDRVTMGFVQHKLRKKEELASSSFTNYIKSFLLKLALQSGRKYKAPAPVATVPDTAVLSDLRKEWDDVRFTLEDVLTETPDELLDKCLFKHPFAGPLTLPQTLTFLQDHFDHHLRIIQQLKHQLIS